MWYYYYTSFEVKWRESDKDICDASIKSFLEFTKNQRTWDGYFSKKTF